MKFMATRILHGAKVLLMAHGWLQGCEIDDCGARCASRAIQDASRECDASVVHAMLARTLIAEIIGERTIEAWNDTPFRKVEEVFAVFDQAILRGRRRAP